MHLTEVLCRIPRMRGPCPKPQQYFRRLPHFRLASMSYGRTRNCWTLTIPSVQKGLVQGAWNRKMKPMYNEMLRVTRLEGALMPYGMTFESFWENLAKLNVMLNKKILSDMALYEPRTFKSVVSLAQKMKDIDGETTEKDRLTRPYPTDLVLGSKFMKF